MAKVFNMTGGGAGGVRLMSISIVTPPNKTVYLSGESFDPAGMVVQAVYSNGAVLTATGYSVEPSGALADGTTAVIIRYTEGGVSVTAQQAITVKPRLTGISVTTPPNKTSYELNESFSTAGMVVTASYSDGSSKAVTGYTVTPSSFAALGTQNVTVSYTESGVTETATTAVTVERITIPTVPSQSGSLTYNESAQSPTWSGYDTAKMTIGGTTSGTNAGTYAATFTPAASYRWADGTTTAKSVNWTIAKAAGSLTLSKTSLSLTSSATTGTVAVTRAGNGAITAASSNTGVATVSVSGTTVSVIGKATGTATITVKVAEGTNHTAPANKTVAVTVQMIQALNDTSWADIKAASDAGQAANYWSVGDRKAITLNGTVGELSLQNYTIYAFIIGFNHNNGYEGGNRIHFQIGKSSLTGGSDICLIDSDYDVKGSTTAFRMNKSQTSSGGWESSFMRLNICGTSLTSFSGTILAVIPSELRSVLKSVTKYTDNTGGSSGSVSSYVTATIDYFFVLSEFEVLGEVPYANTYEKDKQSQYSYYQNGNSKIKFQHNSNTTAAAWWLRSPRASSKTETIAAIDVDGTYTGQRANNSLGFAPGFCV